MGDHIRCWILYIIFSDTYGRVNFTFTVINSHYTFIDRILICSCDVRRISSNEFSEKLAEELKSFVVEKSEFLPVSESLDLSKTK